MVSTLFRRTAFVPGRLSLSTTALFAAALLLAVSGCHRAVTDPNDPKFIVAEKGDWTITRAQLDDEVATYLKQHQKTPQDIGPAKMPMLETAMLDNIVLKKLILARAATLPLKDVDKDEADALNQLKGRFPTEAEFEQQLKGAGLTLDQLKKQIHEDVIIRKTRALDAYQNIDPTEQEINDFYLKNKDKFSIPNKIRASRIVILVDDKTSPADKTAKKKAIDQAHARVTKGEDFGKVATEVSQDRYSAPKGGDIGYFQKGENEAGFDAVAFATKPGTVSAVFETPMGYQFVKVTDVHPGGEVSIAEARDVITKYLRQAKQGQQAEAYTHNLLTNSGVKFHLVRAELPPENPAQGGGAPPTESTAPDARSSGATDASVPAAPPAENPAPSAAPANATPAPAPAAH